MPYVICLVFFRSTVITVAFTVKVSTTVMTAMIRPLTSPTELSLRSPTDPDRCLAFFPLTLAA